MTCKLPPYSQKDKWTKDHSKDHDWTIKFLNNTPFLYCNTCLITLDKRLKK